MAWPSATKASTQHLETDADLLYKARPNIKQNIDNVNDIIDTFDIVSPAAGEILSYSNSSNKFENIAGVDYGNSTIDFSIDIDSVLAYDGDFDGGFTLNGSDDITVGTHASGKSIVTFPAGTYWIRNNHFSYYQSTYPISLVTQWKNIIDDTIEFQSTQKQIGREGGANGYVYFLDQTVTFATDTTVYVYIDYSDTQGSKPHPTINITRIT